MFEHENESTQLRINKTKMIFVQNDICNINKWNPNNVNNTTKYLK